MPGKGQIALIHCSVASPLLGGLVGYFVQHLRSTGVIQAKLLIPVFPWERNASHGVFCRRPGACWSRKDSSTRRCCVCSAAAVSAALLQAGSVQGCSGDLKKALGDNPWGFMACIHQEAPKTRGFPLKCAKVTK